MAYKITYGPPQTYKFRFSQQGLAIFLAVCILVVGCYLVSEWDTLRHLMLPGDAAVTEAALQTFTLQLEQGEDIGRAFACFCREIIENARTE